MGVDPVYGARPMKRYIQRNLETQIAKEMIKTGAMQGDANPCRLSKWRVYI